MDQPERVRYFDEQFLRVEDFTAEQDYHRDMRRRHNRMLHTPGISEGLLLGADGTGVRISPGAAVTPGTDANGGGSEIVVAAADRMELSSFAANADVFVTIAFDEEPSRERDDAGVRGHTRWREVPKIELFTTDPTANPPADPNQKLRLLLGRVVRGGASGTEVVSIDNSGRRIAGSAESELSLTPRDPAVQEPDWVRLRWLARGQAELRGTLKLVAGQSAPGDLTVTGSATVGGQLTVSSAVRGGALESSGTVRARSLRIDTVTADTPSIDIAPAALSFHRAGTPSSVDPRISSDATAQLSLTAQNVNANGVLNVGQRTVRTRLNVFGDAIVERALITMGRTDGTAATGNEVLGGLGFLGWGIQHGQLSFRAGAGFELVDRSTDAPSMDYPAGSRPYADLRAGNIVASGALRPAAGNTAAAGIQFPSDPGGGAGDEAFIRYYVETLGTEHTTFAVGVGNDPEDRLELHQFGAQRLSIFNGNVGIGTRSPAYKLDVAGYIGIGGREALRGDDPWLRLNQAGHFTAGVHTPFLFAPDSLNVGAPAGKGWANPGHGNAWFAGSIEAWGNMTIHGDVRLGSDHRFVYIGGNQNGIFMQLHDDMWLSDPQNGTIQMRNHNDTTWGTLVGILANMSSRRHKTGVNTLAASEFEALLDDVARTELVRYRYRGEEDGRERIGVVSEECPDYLLAGDGESIVVMEYAAMLHGALKALTERVRRLEEQR